jgi:Galactose oxidase, central domain/Kelch motif
MTRLSDRIRVLTLFGVAACALTAIAMAESTPSPYQLIDAHFGMTVTLLADGKVLIVGGGDNHVSATNLAEIYDPATDAFTPAGSGLMPVERANHTATLLKNGRVLIAGGVNRMGTALETAILFDPQSGKFIPTGNMTEPRYAAAATLLRDGRVLISGGVSTSEGYAGAKQVKQEEQSLDTAELYDPKSGKFSPAGKVERVYDITSNKIILRASMTAARREHTATLMTAGPATGQVLIAGGIGDQNKPIPSAELYDPVTNSFKATGNMTVARTYQGASELSDGRVLIAGGTDARDQALATAELYDPASGRFALTAGPMQHARYRQVTVLLNDGDVLLAGGASNVGVLANAEIFDPRTGKFLPTGLMKDYRMAAGAVLLHNGTVFIAGGYNNRPTYAPGAVGMGSAAVSFRVLNTAEIFNPASGQFLDTRSLGRNLN